MQKIPIRLVVAIILASIGLTGFVLGLEYEFGSARRMGPGYFPTVLSGVLLILAFIEGASAVLKPDTKITETIEWRPLIAILGAVAAFAFTISVFGLIPAFMVVVGLSALSESAYGWRPALILSILSCIGAWLLFSQLLGMTLPLFQIRF
ncbi:MAG: tripartite tricarboxylate transporter TctB family protein [Granulosicoccus sp.]